ncbi:MAG: glutathione S-transferase [Burkholderiaceae bacterium]|jgi:glutathione S-transferase|nr:glutathione S-transferase [Burkholderiaceae bacterium]
MMIELLQFRHSPYNEKVRWALDLKGVPHRRRSLLPGPHLATVRKLTGRTHTPVILADGQAIDGSARILQWLEARWPQPVLFPAEAAERAEAQRLQQWFDDDLTPRIRRAVLDALLHQPTAFAGVFGDGRPAWQRLVYAIAVPLAAPLIRKGNGIVGARSVDDGLRAAEDALNFVAQRAGADGYLAGKAFSLADLTAGATLAVLAQPPGSPMAGPQPHGAAFALLLQRFAAHPGIAWTRQLYARHRGASRDFDGPSEGAHR